MKRDSTSSGSGTALVLRPSDETATRMHTSIEALSTPLAEFVRALGLPTEDVLVPVDERLAVLDNLHSALDPLPADDRARAYYVSKFAVATTSGLFDAALSYLWNETIQSLRGLVQQLDLSYFFDVAEKREKYRAQLQGPEDLPRLDEIQLIDACARVGLLSDVDRERLRHINFMRNHASAAHPNQSKLQAFELLGWLKNCLVSVITAKPNLSVLQLHQLLHNIRNGQIPQQDVVVISRELAKLQQDRAEDFLWTLFGMYVDPISAAATRGNISLLAPTLWELASDGRRHEVGARYAYFVKHADQTKRQLANDFLVRVDGLRYRSEDILVPELLDKLRTLEAAHHGANNFYNEWPHAADLASSLPQSGIVPAAVSREWVKVLCLCWIGNGHGYYGGVDRRAVPTYREYIHRFSEQDIATYLGLFADDAFTVSLGMQVAEGRAKELALEFQGGVSNALLRRGLDLIIKAPEGTLRKLQRTSDYERSVVAVRRSFPGI